MKKALLIFLSIFLFTCNQENSIQEGCFEGDCINGEGSFMYPDSMIYKGGWVDGKCNGNGTLTAFDSSFFYTGSFKDNLFNGHGTVFAPTWNYMGEFKNDRLHGLGILKWPDGPNKGAKFIGEFIEGSIYGKGMLMYPDSTIATGVWKSFELIEHIPTDSITNFLLQNIPKDLILYF